MENNSYFDLHISAERVSHQTQRDILSLGFDEDFLRDNVNSVTPHFHASFRQHYTNADDGPWQDVTRLAKSDPTFRGCIEEEITSLRQKRIIAKSATRLTHIPHILPVQMETCFLGEHKACDIHITLDPEHEQQPIKDMFNRANFISFERLKGGQWHRIYSLTFATLDDGQAAYNVLTEVLAECGAFAGKIKLEKVNRFLVHPSDATQLPIIRQPIDIFPIEATKRR